MTRDRDVDLLLQSLIRVTYSTRAIFNVPAVTTTSSFSVRSRLPGVDVTSPRLLRAAT